MPYGTFTYRVRGAQDREVERLVDHQERRPRAARAVGLPPALLGVAPLGRVRRPGLDQAARAQRRRPPPSDRLRARRTAPATPPRTSPSPASIEHQAVGRGGPRDLVRGVGQRVDRARPRAGPAAPACAGRAAAPPPPAAAPRAPARRRRAASARAGATSRCSPTSADSGLPGSPSTIAPVGRTTGPDRLARLDRDAPEQLLDAERRQRRLDVVARADGHAAARHDEIGLERARRTAAPSPRACRARGRRARPSQPNDVSVPAEEQRVRVVHLAAPERRARRDQLVAGRQHDDARPPHAARPRRARPPRATRRRSGVSRDAAVDDDRAGGRCRRPGGGRRRPARAARRARIRAVAVLACSTATIGVGAVRHDAAGGDRGAALAGCERRRVVAGRRPRASPAARGRVGGAQREPVERRVVPAGQVDERALRRRR